jgi:hypothetical protein
MRRGTVYQPASSDPSAHGSSRSSIPDPCTSSLTTLQEDMYTIGLGDPPIDQTAVAQHESVRRVGESLSMHASEVSSKYASFNGKGGQEPRAVTDCSSSAKDHISWTGLHCPSCGLAHKHTSWRCGTRQRLDLQRCTAILVYPKVVPAADSSSTDTGSIIYDA